MQYLFTHFQARAPYREYDDCVFEHLNSPWCLSGEESACHAAGVGSVPGLGRSPGERNGNPLQYSCLGKSMDRGAWRATVHGVTRVRYDLASKPPPLYSHQVEK